MNEEIAPTDRRLNSFEDVIRNAARRLFLLLFCLLPPIGVFAPLGVASLMALAAVCAVVAWPHESLTFIRRQWILGSMFAVLAIWGMLSATWSILPGHSLFEGARFLTLSTSGFFVWAGISGLDNDRRRKLLFGVAIGIVATVAVFLIDLAAGLRMIRFLARIPADANIPLERFDRGTTVLGLIFWPVAFGLWRERRFWLLFSVVLATAIAFVVIPSSTNRLAMVAGLIVALVASWNPRRIAILIVSATVLTALILPFAIVRLLPSNEAVVTLHHQAPYLKFSALHRFLIWRFASEKIAERPLLGWGMDASRELPGGHEKLVETLSEPIIPPQSQALPLHPHNGILQWWVELGIPGVLLCLSIIAGIFLWTVSAARSRPLQVAIVACSVNALVISVAAYGFWQSWWLSSAWLAGALLFRLHLENSAA